MESGEESKELFLHSRLRALDGSMPSLWGSLVWRCERRAFGFPAFELGAGIGGMYGWSELTGSRSLILVGRCLDAFRSVFFCRHFVAACLEDAGTPVPFLWRIKRNFFKKCCSQDSSHIPLGPEEIETFDVSFPLPSYSSASTEAGEGDSGDTRSLSFHVFLFPKTV